MISRESWGGTLNFSVTCASRANNVFLYFSQTAQALTEQPKTLYVDRSGEPFTIVNLENSLDIVAGVGEAAGVNSQPYLCLPADLRKELFHHQAAPIPPTLFHLIVRTIMRNVRATIGHMPNSFERHVIHDRIMKEYPQLAFCNSQRNSRSPATENTRRQSLKEAMKRFTDNFHSNSKRTEKSNLHTDTDEPISKSPKLETDSQEREHLGGENPLFQDTNSDPLALSESNGELCSEAVRVVDPPQERSGVANIASTSESNDICPTRESWNANVAQVCEQTPSFLI